MRRWHRPPAGAGFRALPWLVLLGVLTAAAVGLPLGNLADRGGAAEPNPGPSSVTDPASPGTANPDAAKTVWQARRKENAPEPVAEPAAAPGHDATVWRPHRTLPVPADQGPDVPPPGGALLPPCPPRLGPAPTLPAPRPDPIRPTRPVPGGQTQKADFRPEPPDEAAPRPRPAPEAEPDKPDKEDADKTILLGAARNAVRQKNWDLALARFDEYFKRYGETPELRQEYAGVLVQAGRVRDALKEYQRLVARKPDDKDLRVNLGDVAVLVRDYPLAVTHLRRALELAPNDLEVAAKLARVYVFAEDFTSALRVYDQFLAALKPGDERAPRTLAPLLIDLDRAADAVPFLLALLEKEPSDAEILAALVRAYSRLGDHPKVLEALQALAARAPRAVTARQDLGDTLYASGDYETAALVYGQILQAEPDNAYALVGMARVHLQLFEPRQARAVLESIPPGGPAERVALLTRAEYHQLVGEYLDAKEIYRQFLGRDEADHEARLALAALDEFIREDEKAKAEYAKIPPGTSLSRKARLGVVSTLTQQRRFTEAIDAAKHLAAEYPADGSVIAHAVRTLDKADRFDEAQTLARAFIQNNPRNEGALAAVRLALGKVLLDAGKMQEAVKVYEAVLARPSGRIPAAYYGLARAYAKLGDGDQAHQVLARVTSLIGGDARNRLLLSDLFASDFDDGAAADMAQAVLKWDGDNLAALIRLADAQARIARFTAHGKEAIATAETILHLSPTNVRGRLTLARTLAVAQDYKASAAAYEPLIAADREFQVPQRERARVLYSGHQYGAGAGAYAEMQAPPADKALQDELCAFAEHDPRVGPVLGAYLKAGLPPDVLTAEAAKATAGLGDPDLLEGVRRIFLDYQARRTEQEGARLEGEVKDQNWRPYATIPVSKQLVELEPANTSALFDLGQEYSTLRQTRHALEQYGQEVHIDPGEYEGMTALERASLELRPQLRLGFDLSAENGRDGLARIQRTKYSATTFLPIGDENEFIDLGFARTSLTPHDEPTLQGNIITAGAQKKFCCDERLLLYGQANLELYREQIKGRVTFDAGGRYDFCDLFTGRASTFLENVTENGESLRQDIYRYGARVGGDLRPTRRLVLSGTFTYAHYSDQDDLNELFLKSDLILTDPPCQLKLVLSTDVLGYGNQTVFSHPGTNDLVGTIHPYFAPSIYTYYEARLEWTHWLSRDYFVHSNQLWYGLQYGIGWDDHLNNYHTIRALTNYDVRSWLSVGADAQVVLSPVYNSATALAYVVVRFP